MAKYVVAARDEIPPGARKLVTVAGRSVGVFNVDGEYFALLNRCPHQGGPLCSGSLMSAVTAAAPGEYEYHDAVTGPLLRCPWHGWEFAVRTGQSWVDPNKTRVRRYPVTVEPSGPVQALVAGPYIAETYPVTAEEHVLVVEI
jgi:3-phenylpropionate/trans-cinnamate dioxygenase ferredoxin subunit